MKFKNLNVGCLALAGLFTGCLSEPDFKSVLGDNGEPLEIKLFNEIKQVATTRVNDEGFCDGDAVGIYVVNFVDGSSGTIATDGNQADNVKYVLDEATGAWAPETPVYYLDKTTKVDIYGYYPYAQPTDMKAWPFEVAKDQSREAENGKIGGYEASDFLWAKAESISPTSSRIPLQFHHMMAGVTVSLVEGTGFESGEFASLEKAALVTNTRRQAVIDFSTGNVTATGDIPTTGTIPYKKGESFRAIVVPQTVAANTPLFSLTVGGMPYVFSKADEYTYVPGKLHKFSIQINKKTVGGVEFQILGESITAWESENFTHDGEAREYVIINCETAGGLKEAITASGKDYTQLKNLKITGKVNANDFFFMRDEMTMLQAVNMKEVKIEEVGSWPENEIPSNAFYNKKSLVRFVFPETTTAIRGYAFYLTNLSGSLILPDNITIIGDKAFNNCRYSGTLTLPSNIEVIGKDVFVGQFSGQLILPASLVKIQGSAFQRCGFTGNLILPDGLEVIESTAFESCSNFKGDLVVPASVKVIEGWTFYGCGFDGKLSLPEGLLEIGDYAFERSEFSQELHLPSTLLTIGDRAFGSCKFSGNLVLPESLVYLGNASFFNNTRLSGIIEIPAEIVSIGNSAFEGCGNIDGVILNKNTANIGNNAFAKCYQLNSIVSYAQTPPAMGSGAFDGVAKDNFAVEVPEAAVNSYLTSPGWNEFKRISAHHDFSISRSRFRTLNASDSKTLILRAPSGADWSVESCPDWVTVSPMSGTGKTEVTVTVNEMASADAATVTYEQMNSSGNYENMSFTGRRGEVVFLLNGKDYRSRTVVEQYDYAPDGIVIGDGYVLENQKAIKGQQGVNLVFMGDCFDAKDISEGKYLDAVNEAVKHFFAIAPYAQYKDYFNVYTVVGLSPDSGVGTVNTIREARFGSQYGLQGGGKIAPDASVCFEYACKTPTVNENNIHQTLIVLVENSADYDGICYMYGDGSAIALCPMSTDVYPYDFRGIVQHEAGGHGFAKLADEYIYHNAFIQTCNCNDGCGHVDEFEAMKARGWYANLSLSGNMYDVPWSHFIFDPQYSNVVDIYEGGFFHSRGVFRSEPNSCMNNNVPYYSAISRETIVKRIMEYAGEEYSFDAFKENDVMTVASTTATKAGDSSYSDMSYPVRRGNAPVFMGERPKFN